MNETEVERQFSSLPQSHREHNDTKNFDFKHINRLGNVRRFSMTTSKEAPIDWTCAKIFDDEFEAVGRDFQLQTELFSSSHFAKYC
jgi:hypothetical protein